MKLRLFIRFTSIFLLFTTTISAQFSDVVSGLDTPNEMALDGNILYFSETTFGKISKIDISLANPVVEEVISGLYNPTSIFLVGNYLYVTEFYGYRVSKIDLITSSFDEVVEDSLIYPNGILIDGNDLYISQTLENMVIKVDLSNPIQPRDTIITNVYGPSGLLLNGNDLYIVQNLGDKISKVDITLPNPILIDVVTGIDNPNSDIALVGDELYFSQYIENKISKYNIATNQGPEEVLTDLDGPAGVLADGCSLYIVQNLGNKISKLILGGTEEFWYADMDGDGFGDPNDSTLLCGIPNVNASYVSNNEDCDDTNYEINPNGVEVANNNIDENCDGNDLMVSAIDLEKIKISIYPNPIFDFVKLESSDLVNSTVKIFDLYGKVLKQFEMLKLPTQIDLSNLEAGSYFLEITILDSNQKIVKRIIKF